MAEYPFNTDDTVEALKILDKNFIDHRGVFRRKDKNYTPTELENMAINFLFLEWDYAYDEDIGDPIW
jgi:hypothetical protein